MTIFGHRLSPLDVINGALLFGGSAIVLRALAEPLIAWWCGELQPVETGEDLDRW